MTAGLVFIAVFVVALVGYVALLAWEGAKSAPASVNNRSDDADAMPGHTQGSIPGPWGGGIAGGGGDGL